MSLYAVKTPEGEIIDWTTSHIIKLVIKAATDTINSDWGKLLDLGYSVVEVEVKEVEK